MDEQSKESLEQEIKNAEEVIKKLKKFAEELNNSGNNILTHLCDGLETFLGFNKDSKGYDGQGIVYSDLDRLCDGVMGFLFSIITEVNKDENLQTYNTELPNIMKIIKQALYNGREKFNTNMPLVRQGVARWLKEVNQKHQNVMTPLEHLEKMMNGHGSIEIAYKPITEQLDNWQGIAGLYLGNVQKSVTSLDNVDDNLKEKIASKIDFVKQLVLNFGATVNDAAVISSVKALGNKLIKLPQNINQHIGSEIEGVQTKLNGKFLNIEHRIKEIKHQKRTQFEDVNKAISDGLELSNQIIADFTKDYIPHIEDQYTTLKVLMKSIDPNNKEAPIKGQKSRFKQEVETIKSQIQQIAKNLESRLTELDNWNKAVGSVVGAAQGKCAGILEKVKKEDDVKRTVIYNQAMDLKVKVRRLLVAYEQVHTAVGPLKGDIEDAVEELEGKIQEDLHRIKEEIKKELGKVIDAFKAGIEEANKTITASHFIQEFSLGPGVKENARKLHDWANAIRRSSGLSGAIGQLQGKTNAFDQFKAVLTQLSANQKGEGVFFDVFNQDLDGKVEGKLSAEGSKKVRLSVLDAYGKEKNKEAKRGGRYQTLLRNVSEALSSFKNMDEFRDYQSELDSGATSGAKQSLDLVVGAIEGELSQIAGMVDSTKNTGSSNDGVQQYLNEVNKMRITENTVNLTVKSVIPESVQGLAKIQTEIQKVKSSNVQDVTNAIDGILLTIENLEEFPSAVDAAQQSSVELMNKLKRRIEAVRENIRTIDAAVKTAGEALKSAISKLESSLSEARSIANLELQQLKIALRHRVKMAFNDLQSVTQKMFAEHKKAELNVLRNSVSDQISNLLSVIGDDTETGLKGLMNKLKQTFEERQIYPSDTELNIFADRVAAFFSKFLDDVTWQPDVSSSPDRLTPLADALSSLLSTMHSRNHFDHAVSRKLFDLQSALHTLTPTKFSEASPLLNVVRAGVQAFHGELAKQYVSRYSGKEITWLKDVEGSNPAKQEPTTDAINCARVFLTAIHILAELMDFNEKCMSPALCKKRIFKRNEDTTLAKYLQNYGYGIPSSTETQDGELRRGLTGMIIGTFLTEEKNGHKLFTYLGKPDGTIAKLYGYLHRYYEVRHLATLSSKKHPSSVYDMLRWLIGLPHNTVFPKVSVGDIGQLFEKRDEETTDAGDGPIPVVDDDTLKAHPNDIAASTLTNTLRDLCTHAEDVLIGILGYGHADGIYAVDFNTNPDGFSYPTAPGACFDMLCDVLNRLYQQLYFVYKQCSNDESCAGWLNCWYGQGIGGSSFNCNTRQCANQICDQKANQMGRQIHDQMGDQHPNCGLKSPLQSFLEDGLPGFLPHSFTKPGCKLTCTLSNHRGTPCRTPMGFADISVTASHRQTGEYLKKVLEDFCGKDSSPLTKLCAQLTCLLQKPPQTLGDIFAFYYGYLEEWAGDFYNKPRKPNPYTQVAFNDAVNAAIFGKPYDALNPKILVSSAKHDRTHTKGDLFTIADCTSGSVAPCGLYIKSMTQEISKYYSAEHKANHLSWMVYITETFCDLLKKLYDDCCKKCGPAGSKCHTRSCDEKCTVNYSSDETKKKSETIEHKHACKSIITCRDTHPTLYKYGFTFGKTWALNGSRNETRAKRTCRDFCEALKKMLAEGSVLITLRGQIDDFLWAIRTPFSYLVLALWSLSLFYLLHIMVIRLDLLHIKSHLHSPSSHRIAAQSLLAAGRVNKLGKVFYLQP